MTDENLDLKENPLAITTWNGFIYQGKIALIIALKTIHNFYGTDKTDRNIFVHIEEFEDVSVIQNSQILSLHQVKCKGATTSSSYSDAITKLESKHSISKAQTFLHLSVELSDSFDSTSVYLYDYGNQNFLGINEVHDYVKSLIALIRSKEHIEELNAQASDILAYSLYQDINDIIENAHFANQSLEEDIDKVAREISIHTLFEKIISFNNDIQVDEQYYCSKTKEQIAKEFNLYLEAKSISNEKMSLILQISSQINNFEKDKLYTFLKATNPFWSYEKLNSIDSYIESVPKSFIRPFLNFLDATIDQNGKICANNFRYEHEYEKIKYVPLAIDDDKRNPEITALRLEKALSRNNQFIKLLYRGDHLVTREIDQACVLEFIKNHTKKTFKYTNTTDFDSPMKVPLISYSEAMKLIGLKND